jgi:glycosyltransferase involved in cell wall biosynthesis
MTTLAVTAFNETRRGKGSWLLQCLSAPQPFPTSGIDEIVVVDDGSKDWEHTEGSVVAWAARSARPRTRFFHNEENLGVFANKVESVYRSRGEWVQLCDSDNQMDRGFFERLNALKPWDPSTWYCASFARPEFDYRGLAGEFGVADMPSFLEHPRADCALNTGNQLVHRPSFLALFERFRGQRIDLMQPDHLGLGDRPERQEIYDAVDSHFLNKTWLLAGNRLHFVDGLEYDHRYDATGSNYGRSPEEKTQIPAFYDRELLEAAQCPTT